ncbi:hypothetical protein V1514DRAFT_263426, partial [Lipomyces japonicus]|uniref:uncharacterized protein n=1 Tax=Lipomyces japonicus TaxID=56871 RepID=UPI0034CDBD22
HDYSANEIRQAIANSPQFQSRGSSLPAIVLGLLLCGFTGVASYRILFLHEPVFVPYWISEYDFNQWLSDERKQELRVLTTNALIESIAYKDGIATELGFPISVESLDHLQFSFPPDHDVEYVLHGIELQPPDAKNGGGAWAKLNFKAARVFSVGQIERKLIRPLVEAIG